MLANATFKVQLPIHYMQINISSNSDLINFILKLKANRDYVKNSSTVKHLLLENITAYIEEGCIFQFILRNRDQNFL